MMERIWSIVSGLGLIIAVIFLLRDNMTVAFVAATLGIVAWFLGLRDRLMKNTVAAGEDEAGDHDTGGDPDED
jgi:hypothetical protein